MKIDWPTIQRYYDEGNSFRDITRNFGIANLTITRAVKRGDLLSRAKNELRRGSNDYCKECSEPISESRTNYCSDDCKKIANNRKTVVRVSEWRRQFKKDLVECFAGKCAICQIADHPGVYDFHHLDEGSKDFSISNRGNIRSWALIVQEVEKCVMLCCMCHRKYHLGLVAIPDDAPRFRDVTKR